MSTAIIEPARLLGILDHVGTIEQGKQADLLLVDGNPLESLDVLHKPRGVMLRGRWLDRTALDAL